MLGKASKFVSFGKNLAENLKLAYEINVNEVQVTKRTVKSSIFFDNLWDQIRKKSLSRGNLKKTLVIDNNFPK